MARTKSDGPGVSIGITKERRRAMYRVAEMVVEGGHTDRRIRGECRVGSAVVKRARELLASGECRTAAQLGERLWSLRVAAHENQHRWRMKRAVQEAMPEGAQCIQGWQVPTQSPPKYPAGCSSSNDNGIPVHTLRLQAKL